MWYILRMLDLSPATEALARRLAEAQCLSPDELIRQALEARLPKALKVAPSGRLSAEDIARRRSSLARAVRDIAALPDLDPRTSREIMDDLDPL